MTDAERDAMWEAIQSDVPPSFVVAAPILMVVLATIGILMIVGLWWAWARSNRRLSTPSRSGATAPQPDIWRESGRRATGDDKPPTEPVRPSIPEGDDDISPSDWTPDDDDPFDPQDEDDEPWR